MTKGRFSCHIMSLFPADSYIFATSQEKRILHNDVMVISKFCYMQNPSRRFRSGQNQSANREKSALRGQRVAKTYESALVLQYECNKRIVPAFTKSLTFAYMYMIITLMSNPIFITYNQCHSERSEES